MSTDPNPSSLWPAEIDEAPPIYATPERWQHGQERERKKGREAVRDGVANLRKAGKISDADVAACQRWHNEYMIAIHGVYDPHPSRPNVGGGDAITAGLARGRVSASFSRAEHAAGLRGSAILVGFVVLQKSIESIGELFKVSCHEARGMIIATIIRLTEHYASADSRLPRRQADFSA